MTERLVTERGLAEALRAERKNSRQRKTWRGDTNSVSGKETT